MKIWFTVICLCFGLAIQAQDIKKDVNQYEVKKGRIYLDNKDITDTFTIEQRKEIIERLEHNAAEIKLKEAEAKAQKKKEKQIKKAEKAQKKAEKAAKKAERELKRKEKAQKSLDKADKALKKAQKKYNKLKSRGKLSPEDEKKWLGKIEKLSKKLEKAKRRG